MIIGIIGEFCAGKTVISEMLFNSLELNKKFPDGIFLFDGDKYVRKLYAENLDLIQKIQNIYPECISDEIVNKEILSTFFFQSAENQLKIEETVYPFLKDEIAKFISRHSSINSLIILDIPVLFKTGLENICEFIFFLKADYSERLNRGTRKIQLKDGIDKKDSLRRFLNIENITIKIENIPESVTNKTIFVDTTNGDMKEWIKMEETLDYIVQYLI